MQKLIDDFKRIGNEPDLRAFLLANGFRTGDSRSHSDQYVLGVFLGKVDGINLKLTHRLFDHGKSAADQGDNNQLVLEIEGASPIEVGFVGNY